MKIAIASGASSGIGKAAALRLAGKGFQVLAGVRRPSDAAFWKTIPNARAIQLDVAESASVESAAKEARSLLQTATEVNLVNNAGIAVAGPIEAVTMSRWHEQFEVNVFGLVRVTQAFLPFIRTTKGRIVNISSVSGLATSPYMGPYSASKYAVEAISDALRRELRQFGCKVIAIEPGPIATPIWEKNLAKKEVLLQELPPELREAYLREFTKFLNGVQRSARSAVSVELVSDVIEKALTSPRPRARYMVGTKSLKAQMIISEILPARWSDALIAQAFR